MGYIKPGLEFKYAKRVEMSDEDKIKLFQVLGTQWEMDPDAVESEFGVKVKRQINAVQSGISSGGDGTDNNVVRHLTDEEYFKRYGHYRETKIFDGERNVETVLLSNIKALKSPDDSKEKHEKNMRLCFLCLPML